jgi:hypothetical protein
MSLFKVETTEISSNDGIAPVPQDCVEIAQAAQALQRKRLLEGKNRFAKVMSLINDTVIVDYRTVLSCFHVYFKDTRVYRIDWAALEKWCADNKWELELTNTEKIDTPFRFKRKIMSNAKD